MIRSFKLLLTLAAVALTLTACASDTNSKQARAVVERTFGAVPRNVRFETIVTSPDSKPCYAQSVKNGVLTVEGNSVVALCRGFYDYITLHGYGTFTWSGSRLELPARLPDMERVEVTSPFDNHLFYNVCTFGYTMPFWDWQRWEQEIDWLALHGFDMPLMPVGGEAIMARVWRGLGMSDEQIDPYFTGPAHMPWMRMGNMTELDGAPSAEWHEGQLKLAHQIVDRMKQLGMSPVYQGFAGFVPEAVKELYSDVTLTQTDWAGMKSWLLSPLDSLFARIGTDFVKSWESEFGKGKYYLIDSFNELDVPFGAKGSPERAATLNQYSSTIYNSLAAANPDAVWVMQGWMFGYQRTIWDPESVKALLGGAPDGKLMVIDLAVDFNKDVWRSERSWNYLDGMFGKEWIYSTVPNFGGRSALIGDLDFYANAHWEALESANCGRLTGYGTSPEGIENNDVVYEVIGKAGWNDSRFDTADFLKHYTEARYGADDDAVEQFWRLMMGASYGAFTNNGRYKWQMRPYVQRLNTMGINDNYFEAIESFLSAADRLGSNDNYKTDAVLYGAMYLCSKADITLDSYNEAILRGESEAADNFANRTLELLGQADSLLESHPLLRLSVWTDYARRAGTSVEESDRFVREALRLVTVWGGPSLYDYSARVWSGLIRDYYIPRVKHYFDLKAAGSPSDFAEWDEERFKTLQLTSVEPYADPVARAVDFTRRAADIDCTSFDRPEGQVAFWTPYELGSENARLNFSMPQADFLKMNKLRFVPLRGHDRIEISKITFTANRKTWASVQPSVSVGKGEVTVAIDKVPVDEPLSKEVSVNVWFKNRVSADSYGRIIAEE